MVTLVKPGSGGVSASPAKCSLGYGNVKGLLLYKIDRVYIADTLHRALFLLRATHEDSFVIGCKLMNFIPQWRAKMAPFRPVRDGFGRGV
jgi:hypothetical protein